MNFFDKFKKVREDAVRSEHNYSSYNLFFLIAFFVHMGIVFLLNANTQLQGIIERLSFFLNFGYVNNDYTLLATFSILYLIAYIILWSVSLKPIRTKNTQLYKSVFALPQLNFWFFIFIATCSFFLLLGLVFLPFVIRSYLKLKSISNYDSAIKNIYGNLAGYSDIFIHGVAGKANDRYESIDAFAKLNTSTKNITKSFYFSGENQKRKSGVERYLSPLRRKKMLLLHLKNTNKFI